MLNPGYQFWMFQIAGWLGLALLTYFSLTAGSGTTTLPYTLHPFVQSMVGILVAWPLRSIYRSLWDKSFVIRSAFIVIAVLASALIWTLLRLGTFIFMTGEEKNFLPEFGAWYFPGVLVFTGWTALYHGVKYYRLLQDEHLTLLKISDEMKEAELKRAQAESIARDAQIRMLRYQLNPHFLFNTMNSIKSLINSGRNSGAMKTIDQLSVFLRTSLDSDPKQPVTLRQEIETLQLYLGIEQTRFVDRLKLEFEVAEDTLDCMVPGLLLQPLAENAIKHAIAPSADGGTIRVIASLVGDRLNVLVEDTGPGIEGLQSGTQLKTGIGLKNTRKRLDALYGDGYEVTLEQVVPHGLRVLLWLPIDRADSRVDAKPDRLLSA